MALNLRDLSYFEAVAEMGHLGQAAERLGRTQPALTKSIQRLEAAVGAPLFERAGRGIRLTAVGEVLQARARQLRAASEEAMREVADFAQGQAGHVRIGSGPIAADQVLPELCRRLLGEAPRTTIEIAVGPSTELRTRLADGEIDLLIGLVPMAQALFETHPIFEDAVVVAGSPSHPIFTGGVPTLERLLAHPWALPAASIPSRQWLDAVFLSRGLPSPRAQVTANSIPLLPALIARTGLLSFVSRRTLVEPSQGQLREVRLTDTTLIRTLGVTHRRGGYLSPAACRVVALLRLHGEDLMGQSARIAEVPDE